MSAADIKAALPQDRLIAEPFTTDEAALAQLRAGKLDHHPLVQAFISHREDATAEAAGLSAEALAQKIKMQTKIARVTEFLRQYLEPWGSWKTEWWERQVSATEPYSDEAALRHVLEVLKS